MRFLNEKGMRFSIIARYIHIEPGIELKKLPAHFNVQIKNDEIDIIYLIIKE